MDLHGRVCEFLDQTLGAMGIPLEVAIERALNGELTDAKTIIGILRAAAHKKIA